MALGEPIWRHRRWAVAAVASLLAMLAIAASQAVAAAGVVPVKDINRTGTWLTGLTNVNGTLFFSARDMINGTELWKSDGASKGTALVKDINPGPSDSTPHDLTAVN